MTPLEVVVRQGEIIRLQSEMITGMYGILAQHEALDEIEKDMEKIEALKKEIQDEI